jgi:predicted metal-dependent TIM-barrel fold hydrolase
MTYCIYTIVSGIVIRALQCDDDFKASRNSPYFGDAFLYQDYTVSCNSKRYKLYKIYAIVMVFVYPIGIPLLYVAVLYKAKMHIAPSDVVALAEDIVRRKPEVEKDFLIAKADLGDEIDQLELEHQQRKGSERCRRRSTVLSRLRDQWVYATW